MENRILVYYKIVLAFGIGILLFNPPMPYAFDLHDINFDVTVYTDMYRIDSLNWNIAGQNLQPNILSELKFHDLEIYQTGLAIQADFNRLYLRTSVYSGTIEDGKGNDSDYNQDDRRGLYGRSKSEIRKDELLDTSSGVGYQFHFLAKKFMIAPLIGASYHEQGIHQTDGTQTVATAGLTPATGSISGLDSIYATEWFSTWVGTDIHFEVTKRLFLSAALEYHEVKYSAEANWNLREDFSHPLSFAHEAGGEGPAMKIGFNHSSAAHWNVGVIYARQKWSVQGDDLLFLATGETIVSKLNDVSWEYQSINLSLSYIH